MHIFWYLPTQGDERYISSSVGQREPTFDYLKQITQAVDQLGYEGMLLGTGLKQDPWIIATALISATKRLKFLVAHRPSIYPPSLAARQAATFDQISEGRLLLNIVTAGGSLKHDGVFLGHDERYALTDEWLEIYRRLFLEESVTFAGKHLRIEGGRQLIPSIQQPYPGIFFGGSSEPALEVAGKHVDVYLTWGEPPHLAKEKFDRVREHAAKHDRTVKFGVRAQVVVRETSAEAWEAAYKIISRVDDATIERAQNQMKNADSEGQRRIQALHDGDRSKLEIFPNLWGGIGLVRGGAGTAFVGSAQEVVELLHKYEEVGADHFVLSGYPHLEEAYHFAENVFPLINLEYDDPKKPRLADIGVNANDAFVHGASTNNLSVLSYARDLRSGQPAVR